MDELNNGVIRIVDVRKRLAPDFLGTFKSLLNVMAIQETKERAKLIKEASQASSFPTSSGAALKRGGASQSPTFSAKRIRTSISPSPLPEPRTPDQPTYPADPDYTGDSSLSIASKDEENTKKLLHAFLSDVMSVLEGEFSEITWHRSGSIVELSDTYLLVK